MDPNQQQQLAGLMAGMGAAILIVSLLFTAFLIFCLWRIFTKAGMSGALSLISIVPFIGPIIVLCILAFGRWNVAPITPGYATTGQPYPPAYPPQAYPPAANYPPTGPPSQL